jgi:choline dehydrogenase-like flavoprotein
LIDELDELGLRRCRANWTPAEDDINNTVDFNSRFGALVGASGLGRVQVVDGLDREEIFSNLVRQSSGGGHQMGTTRMSNDSSTGVVDANLKVHGVENLYCAGSSVFPTFSWVNPTMTIVALSIRLAAHLSQVKQ